jgi:hypothetical protein
MIPQIDLDRALARWKARQSGHELPVAEASPMLEATAEVTGEAIPQEMDGMNSSGIISLDGDDEVVE